MDYRLVIGDTITLSDGVRGKVVSITQNIIAIQLEDGSICNIEGRINCQINTKFTTESDALIHAVEAVNKSHCSFCGNAKLYSLELLDKPLLEQLLPERGELSFKGVVNFLSCEYSSCCYHLLPQIEGAFNRVLSDEGLLNFGDGYPKWSRSHPNMELHGKPCKNLVQAINGAALALEVSKMSHVKDWLGEGNIEELRQLRNKLLHGELTKVSQHDAALVVTMIQCIKHGIEGMT
ncbi:hypothetical protein KS878_004324 [Vibrio parahaemolyticus]|nr:hypothetical protein [Vibrio parahaemolyticus]EIZ1340215.1 hypothetical protein [Vibrio parahaemolyticus]